MFLFTFMDKGFFKITQQIFSWKFPFIFLLTTHRDISFWFVSLWHDRVRSSKQNPTFCFLERHIGDICAGLRCTGFFICSLPKIHMMDSSSLFCKNCRVKCSTVKLPCRKYCPVWDSSLLSWEEMYHFLQKNIAAVQFLFFCTTLFCHFKWPKCFEVKMLLTLLFFF